MAWFFAFPAVFAEPQSDLTCPSDHVIAGGSDLEALMCTLDRHAEWTCPVYVRKGGVLVPQGSTHERPPVVACTDGRGPNPTPDGPWHHFAGLQLIARGEMRAGLPVGVWERWSPNGTLIGKERREPPASGGGPLGYPTDLLELEQAAAPAVEPGTIDLLTASAEQLSLIPGVTYDGARRLVEGRASKEWPQESATIYDVLAGGVPAGVDRTALERYALQPANVRRATPASQGAQEESTVEPSTAESGVAPSLPHVDVRLTVHGFDATRTATLEAQEGRMESALGFAQQAHADLAPSIGVDIVYRDGAVQIVVTEDIPGPVSGLAIRHEGPAALPSYLDASRAIALMISIIRWVAPTARASSDPLLAQGLFGADFVVKFKRRGTTLAVAGTPSRAALLGVQLTPLLAVDPAGSAPPLLVYPAGGTARGLAGTNLFLDPESGLDGRPTAAAAVYQFFGE